jgi:hypothetical protein
MCNITYRLDFLSKSQTKSSVSQGILAVEISNLCGGLMMLLLTHLLSICAQENCSFASVHKLLYKKKRGYAPFQR